MRFQPAAMAFAVTLATAAHFAAPAFAGTATQDEAASLQAALSDYFGKVPGVVSVTPDGDNYQLHIDPDPLLAKLPPDVSASLTPLDYTLTAEGGGIWKTSLKDAPITLTIKSPGKFDQTVSIAKVSSNGTFDTTMGTFTDSATTLSGLTVDQTQMMEGKAVSKVHYTVDQISSKTTGTAGAHGVDLSIAQTGTGLAESVEFTQPPAPGAKPRPPMHFTVTANSFAQNLNATGLRWSGILALYRWVVDHPTEPLRTAAKGELSTLVTAALPVFDNITGNGALSGVVIGTPMGPIGLDKVGFNVGLNGVVDTGMFSEAVSFEGLKLPPGITPPWAAPFVPEKLTLDFKVDQFDLAAPAKLLLAAFESGADTKDKAFEDKLAAAALPEGMLQVSTANTGIVGKDFAISVQGSGKIGPAASMPPADVTITATGFDAILKHVDGLPPQMKQQALPMLMLARGFGKPGPDGGMVWRIQTSPEGHLLVNGQDMGPIGKKKTP